MKSKEVIKTIFIKVLQDFDNYDKLNPVESKTEDNKILRNLGNIKKEIITSIYT